MKACVLKESVILNYKSKQHSLNEMTRAKSVRHYIRISILDKNAIATLKK